MALGLDAKENTPEELKLSSILPHLTFLASPEAKNSSFLKAFWANSMVFKVAGGWIYYDLG